MGACEDHHCELLSYVIESLFSHIHLYECNVICLSSQFSIFLTICTFLLCRSSMSFFIPVVHSIKMTQSIMRTSSSSNMDPKLSLSFLSITLEFNMVLWSVVSHPSFCQAYVLHNMTSTLIPRTQGWELERRGENVKYCKF